MSKPTTLFLPASYTAPCNIAFKADVDRYWQNGSVVDKQTDATVYLNSAEACTVAKLRGLRNFNIVPVTQTVITIPHKV